MPGIDAEALIAEEIARYGQRYWPEGEEPPQRLLYGFKALEEVKKKLDNIDLDKMPKQSFAGLKNNPHLKDVSWPDVIDTLEKYDLMSKVVKP